MKKILIIVLALSLILCSCGGSDTKLTKTEDENIKDDIILGVVMPMQDHEMIYGIQLAINEINLSGGINGHQTLVTFLNYEKGNLHGLEGLKSLDTMLFINLSNVEVFSQLKDYNPAILSTGTRLGGETTFDFSGFDSEGFEKLFKTKYNTKPNYTTAKAYEMVYMAKELIEISNSTAPDDLVTALKSYNNFTGKFHSSVTTVYNPL